MNEDHLARVPSPWKVYPLSFDFGLLDVSQAPNDTVATAQSLAFSSLWTPAGFMGSPLFGGPNGMPPTSNIRIQLLQNQFWTAFTVTMWVKKTLAGAATLLVSLRLAIKEYRVEIYFLTFQDFYPTVDDIGAVMSVKIATDERLFVEVLNGTGTCLLYTSPSPRDSCASRMPSSA